MSRTQISDHSVVMDGKTRRKLADQRRMRYRRAIEHYDESRRLQRELADYPELVA